MRIRFVCRQHCSPKGGTRHDACVRGPADSGWATGLLSQFHGRHGKGCCSRSLVQLASVYVCHLVVLRGEKRMQQNQCATIGETAMLESGQPSQGFSLICPLTVAISTFPLSYHEQRTSSADDVGGAG
jgi:hypothetical protein